MTLSGWIVCLLSVGGTTGFFAWCVWRVLHPPGRTDKMHGVLDTEMRIEEEEKKTREVTRPQRGGSRRGADAGLQQLRTNPDRASSSA